MSERLFSVSDSLQHRRVLLLQAAQFVLQFSGRTEHVGGTALIAAVLVVNARRLVCGRSVAFQVMGREPDGALTAEQDVHRAPQVLLEVCRTGFTLQTILVMHVL